MKDLQKLQKYLIESGDWIRSHAIDNEERRRWMKSLHNTFIFAIEEGKNVNAIIKLCNERLNGWKEVD